MDEQIPNLHLDGITPEHTAKTEAKFKKWQDFVAKGGLEDDKYLKEMASLLKDPTIYAYAFFRNLDGSRLEVYPYQDILLNANHKRIMITSANQIGKSFYLCLKHLIFALQNPGTTSLILSRSMFQAKDLMNKIRDLLKLSVLDYKSTIGETETKTEITLKHLDHTGKELKESRIVVAPASETALGISADLLSGDEFPYWDSDLKYMYYQILQPRTYHTKGAIQLIGNPNGMENFYYELWLGDEFHKYKTTFLDCPKNTQEEFEQLCKGMPQAQIDSTLLGKFTAGSGTYFSFEEINAMLTRRSNFLPPPALISEPFWIFLDLAKMNDRTVRYCGHKTKDGGVYVLETFEYPEKTPYNEIVDDLKRLVTEYGSQKISGIGWDASGVGGAVEDWIRPLGNLGVNIVPIKFTLQSKTQMYTLLKLLAEKNLREQGTSSGIDIPYSDDAKSQFSKLMFKRTASGQLMIHHAKESDRDDYTDCAAGLCHLVVNPEHIPASFVFLGEDGTTLGLIGKEETFNTLKESDTTQCKHCGCWLDVWDEYCPNCFKDVSETKIEDGRDK
jgi:hypothetical protein